MTSSSTPPALDGAVTEPAAVDAVSLPAWSRPQLSIGAVLALLVLVAAVVAVLRRWSG